MYNNQINIFCSYKLYHVFKASYILQFQERIKAIRRGEISKLFTSTVSGFKWF